MVRKDFEQLFSKIEPPKSPAGLFDRIILAIKRERESRDGRRLALGFLALLAASLLSAPFSWTFLLNQTIESGILQFISAAMSDFGAFLALWPDSLLAIAESLPIVSVTLFIVNMIIAVFTIRLFLYKKRLLVGYLIKS